MKKLVLLPAALLLAALLLPGCTPGGAPALTAYQLDADTGGVIEYINGIYNTTVVSNDPNVYKAEYEAGFIEGRLQKAQVPAVRDNGWDVGYLVDPTHSYPAQIPPSPAELALAQRTMRANWDYTVGYIRKQGASDLGKKMRRIMYRLIGIYHGASREGPAPLDFNDTWFPSFSEAELTVGYETPSVTFMDVYFINSLSDIFDVLPDNPPPQQAGKPTKCSAFVKRLPGGDIVIAHNSWYGFLDQSQALNLWVNGDYLSMNLFGPGLIGSFTDFGYNNKGLMFNETTDHATFSRPEALALWTMWRGTLAEQFASSITEFYDYATLELSGTYMNSYMVVDTRTGQLGVVDMSYRTSVLFKTDGRGGIEVAVKPDGQNRAYDTDLVTDDHLLGINYPASRQIVDDVKAVDNRPARKRQFMARIGTVTDVDSARALITYTDPANPLSIFGRWDLGYGETPSPKTVPDGSIDAKVVSASMTAYTRDLKGVLDTSSNVKTFWMKWGTPLVNGKPFAWSASPWKGQKLRFVPDVIDGPYTLLSGHIR